MDKPIYELERIRYYQYYDKTKLIGRSDNLDYLIQKANKIKIKFSKNYDEKIRIAKYIDNEVVDYPYIRVYGEK